MNICLYGSASDAIDPLYMRATEALGEEMARRGHRLIFGGGKGGLMGAAARGVVRSGGQLTGVAPRFFRPDGVLFEDCTEFIFTDTMRERKQQMEDHADSFIMTPGGIGTFEEFFEIYTLRQLHRTEKPLAVFDVNGYFSPLRELLRHAVRENFVRKESLDICFYESTPAALLCRLEEEAGKIKKA